MSKVSHHSQQIHYQHQREHAEQVTKVTMKDDAQWFANALLSRNDRIEMPTELLDSLNSSPPPKNPQVKAQPSAAEQAQEMATYAMQSPLAHRLMAQCQQAALEFSKTKRT
ncbi:hypothetical protein TDB9533_00632 [Thalassocella blandensis]|nr:hypothetical protein TDB9533_00632 [Thalassocella blandensis]